MRGDERLIFVRNGIIAVAREDADDMVPSEATLYDTCVAELGPEGTEVMLTRISCSELGGVWVG